MVDLLHPFLLLVQNHWVAIYLVALFCVWWIAIHYLGHGIVKTQEQYRREFLSSLPPSTHDAFEFYEEDGNLMARRREGQGPQI